jgi:drug/metabolite transporter (DMT)-like permease
MILSGICLLLFYLFFSKKPVFRRKRDYLYLLGVSIFHILIPFTTEYVALQSINPSGVCLFYNLSPIFSAFYSYVFFKEQMTNKKWAGLGISLIGIIYFTNPTIFVDPLAIFSAQPSVAHLLMFISVATASLGWILVRVLVKNRGFSPLFVNGIAMLSGGVFALPLSSAFEGKVDLFAIEGKGVFFLLLAALIILANVVFYNLYSYLLKKYTATILAFFGLLTPLFVVILESIFLDIPISYTFFISVFIISFGIYIFYQEELQQGYISLD